MLREDRIEIALVDRHHHKSSLRNGEARDVEVVRAVAQQVFMPLTVGGGIRTIDDVRGLLNAGADKVSINTSAVQNPQLVADASGLHAVPGLHIINPTDAVGAGDLARKMVTRPAERIAPQWYAGIQTRPGRRV